MGVHLDRWRNTRWSLGLIVALHCEIRDYLSPDKRDCGALGSGIEKMLTWVAVFPWSTTTLWYVLISKHLHLYSCAHLLAPRKRWLSYVSNRPLSSPSMQMCPLFASDVLGSYRDPSSDLWCSAIVCDAVAIWSTRRGLRRVRPMDLSHSVLG